MGGAERASRGDLSVYTTEWSGGGILTEADTHFRTPDSISQTCPVAGVCAAFEFQSIPRSWLAITPARYRSCREEAGQRSGKPRQVSHMGCHVCIGQT